MISLHGVPFVLCFQIKILYFDNNCLGNTACGIIKGKSRVSKLLLEFLMLRWSRGFFYSLAENREREVVFLFVFTWVLRFTSGKEEQEIVLSSQGQLGSLTPENTGQRWKLCLTFVHTAWRYYREIVREKTRMQTTSWLSRIWLYV
jgi:hypothetical protein